MNLASPFMMEVLTSHDICHAIVDGDTGGDMADVYFECEVGRRMRVGEKADAEVRVVGRVGPNSRPSGVCGGPSVEFCDAEGGLLALLRRRRGTGTGVNS